MNCSINTFCWPAKINFRSHAGQTMFIVSYWNETYVSSVHTVQQLLCFHSFIVKVCLEKLKKIKNKLNKFKPQK